MDHRPRRSGRDSRRKKDGDLPPVRQEIEARLLGLGRRDRVVDVFEGLASAELLDFGAERGGVEVPVQDVGCAERSEPLGVLQ
jgi:hypothetical protein